MRLRGYELWQVWTRGLQIAGGVSLAVCTAWFIGLDFYFASRGPYGPVPEKGWTVPLHWLHGYYGTWEENQQILRLFNYGWWSFWPLFIGSWNRQWREQKNPWRWTNPQERLPMNWPFVGGIVLLVTIAMCFAGWTITAPVYWTWIESLTISGWWSWPPEIIGDVGLLCALGAFIWKLYRDATTELAVKELR